jgi:hypothetical protein
MFGGAGKAKIWQPENKKLQENIQFVEKLFYDPHLNGNFKKFVIKFRVFGVGFHLVNFCAFKFLRALSF